MSKLADLMRVDPLAEAEKLTGQSYKNDDTTSRLGLFLHLDHSDRVKAAAIAERDTYYSIDFAGALEIYTDLGFEVLLDDEVGVGDRTERFLTLWHPDGILGTLESYMGDGMNSMKIWYNVESGEALPWDVTSSGRYVVHEEGRKVWSGDHDGRTGLRASIAGLREHGKFLAQWVDQPFLWLVSYGESRDLEDLPWQEAGAARKDVTRGRIERLPAAVRAAISPEGS